MSIKEQLVADMKTAMRNKESRRLESIRLLRAAIQRREVDDQIELDDSQVLSIVQKQVKQSQDAADQFRKGEREDLASKEMQHIAILESYLPAQLSEEELSPLIDKAIKDVAASEMRDMGKVIGKLRPEIEGRADMSKVSALIKQRLSTS